MPMVKMIPPGSQDLGDKIAELVKLSNRGLRGNDLVDFVKRAGHEFADKIKKTDIKDGDVLVHLIAMGAMEKFSYNRNFDGWSADNLRRDHPTFVKKARFYRNHQNKNPAKSYGIVKASFYNEPMSRVELLVCLNGNKKAAKRNGGLVADKELEKLANNEDIPVSMATTVPWDECSCCHNRAKNRAEYCTEKTCSYGGLKNNIGKVFENGKALFADNIYSSFFDISNVLRNADRIAFVLGKAASAKIIGGAQLAEEWGIIPPLFLEDCTPRVAKQIKIALSLADIESNLKNDTWNLSFAGSNDNNHNYISKWACEGKRQEILRALSLEKIAMPLIGFLEFCGCDPTQVDIKSITQYLPGIYTKLTKSAGFQDLIEQNVFIPSNTTNKLAKTFAMEKAADYSLDSSKVKNRALRSSFYYECPKLIQMCKQSMDNSAAENLAIQYALYKLAFLADIQDTDKDFNLTSELVVRQNFV